MRPMQQCLFCLSVEIWGKEVVVWAVSVEVRAKAVTNRKRIGETTCSFQKPHVRLLEEKSTVSASMRQDPTNIIKPPVIGAGCKEDFLAPWLLVNIIRTRICRRYAAQFTWQLS